MNYADHGHRKREREEMLTRREALTAAAVGAAALVTDAPAAWAHDHAIPGVRGMDHVGITVPDIAEARAWFEDVIGCWTPLKFGPFSDPTGTFMQDLLEVDPRAVIPEINMLRCGTGSNIELFEYISPDQDTRLARNSDFSGHHLAFYVEDIDVAVAYMEAKGVRKLFGPFPVTGGPAAGQSINYFQAPFGTYVELISYPHGMAYESTAKRKLWSAHDIGAKAIDKGIPGLLGLDHVGITVPDVKLARKWLEKNLGGVAPLRFGPISDPTGTFMTDLVDVNARAVIDEINVVRVCNGSNIELFQYSSPDQDTSFAVNSSYSGHHIAVYVDDIDRAATSLGSRRGARKLLGPLPVTAGPAAGQSINYFGTPLGTYFELISYPHGMAYEKTAAVRLWSPKDVGSRHGRAR
jgi:catechol 2,3-dioxygenase-like lactoylglutathione lyase family enzyme